ncbi:MAG: acyl-CoA dehydrogenase family protein, partial [Elioraea tepidiphila]
DLTASEIAGLLVDDPQVDAILLFLEAIRRADLLAEAARRAHAAGKPIIAYKLGRSAFGAELANSHTGALAGSDAAALASTARRDGDGWVLDGHKRWVTNAPEAGMLMVMARTGGEGARGISAFALDSATPGVHVLPDQQKMGMRGARVADILFEKARIPADALVGAEGEGLKLALAGLDKVRLHLAALSAGLMERLIDEGRAHALRRTQFGRPLAEQPAIMALLADSAAEALAARCMALELARARDEGRLRPAEAAAAKLFATEALGRVADRMLQAHGGEGYMQGSAVERLY